MNLHINKELFDQAVIMASETMMINPAIIEKDYYVTYLLKELIIQEPNIIFKGGTSLSKCYKLINLIIDDSPIGMGWHKTANKITGTQKGIRYFFSRYYGL